MQITPLDRAAVIRALVVGLVIAVVLVVVVVVRDRDWSVVTVAVIAVAAILPLGRAWLMNRALQAGQRARGETER